MIFERGAASLPTPRGGGGTVSFVGAIRRTLVVLLDAVAAAVAIGGIGYLLDWLLPKAIDRKWADVAVIAVLVALWFVLFPLSVSVKGGTFGMRLLRCEVLADGPNFHVNLATATLRSVLHFAWVAACLWFVPSAKFLPDIMNTRDDTVIDAIPRALVFLVFLLPVWWMLIDLKSRTLFDVILRQVVVTGRS